MESSKRLCGCGCVTQQQQQRSGKMQHYIIPNTKGRALELQFGRHIEIEIVFGKLVTSYDYTE